MYRLLLIILLFLHSLFAYSSGVPLGLGGQFDGLSGAYRIPIRVAPGTRGMQPQLAIRYAHGAATGALGVGFELEGLSAIEFAPRTPYYDSQWRELRYDGADALVLDGVRLVEAGLDCWVPNSISVPIT